MTSAALNAVTTADRGFTWSDEETLVLLQLWSDVFLNADMKSGNNKNFILYEKISEEMNNVGFVRTASQCKEKIKRMKREYTLTKQKNQSGKNKKNMRFFEQFEKILMDIQNRTLQVPTSSSGADVVEIKDDKNNNRNECNLRNIAPKTETWNLRKRRQPVDKTKETSNPWTPDVVLVEEEPQPTTSKISNSDILGNGEPTKKKTKSSSQLLRFKSLMDSLTLKFIKYQTESDEKMLKKFEDLENERTALDERIQKMWLDFEERRQISEREHELNIMSTFQDIINQ